MGGRVLRVADYHRICAIVTPLRKGWGRNLNDGLTAGDEHFLPP